MDSLQDELERSAKFNEAQVHAILEAAINAIITIDRQGRIRLCNRAAQKMFGYTPEELVGQKINMLMPEPFRQEHDGYVRKYLYTGQKKIIGVGRETMAMRKDGSVFPIELSVSEARVGEDVTFTGIVRDITERKRLEKEILEISEREQRRIGQDLHDGLCQQLTGIAFLVQALQQKLVARDASSAAQVAQISVLLKEAVTQARILSHGLYPVDPEPNGLMEALGELAASVRTVFALECVLNCPDPVMMHDNSAATHLYRVAQESVHNAIRHGKATALEIRFVRSAKGVQLSITDNGSGFPEAGAFTPGMGLRTMNHRAKVIGATLTIERLPEGGSGGTRVTCDAPNAVDTESTGKRAGP